VHDGKINTTEEEKRLEAYPLAEEGEKEKGRKTRKLEYVSDMETKRDPT
jgi:hypothetical protein